MSVRSRYLLALLLFVFLTGLLTLPARLHVGDPYTWREEARSLILRHQLSVPEDAALSHGETDQYFVRNPRNGLYYSKYGVMNGILNVIPLFAEYKIHKKLEPWDSPIRRLYLGLFALSLSLLIGWLLFRICLHYTESPSLATLYVLLAFFTTYLHYYLRASNTEATQVLFFCAWFERVLRFKKSGYKDSRHLHWAWLFVLCLALTKISFLLLVPFAALPFLARPDRFKPRAILELSIPVLLIAGVVAFVSFVRFGSPLNTGYQWARDDLANTLPAWKIIPNLFFNEQWSLPTHFPLLLLVPFGARRFYRENRYDSWLLLALAFAFFFSIGRLPIWRGEWSYGPRYFLFFLPVLCLPALTALENLQGLLRKKSKPALAAALLGALVFGYSAQLQLAVARVDPFFYYWMRPPVVCDKSVPVRSYFARVHFARFASEVWAERKDPTQLWWFKEISVGCPYDELTEYEKRLKTWINRTNFYWFSPLD